MSQFSTKRFPLRALSVAGVALTSGMLLTACTEAQRTPDLDAQQQFFYELGQLCGNAYQGERVVERQDREDMLQGDEELIVHFRECDANRIYAAFHIGSNAGMGDWDRSRTWVYTAHEERLELRHDHRLEDGSEDTDNTMYGGYTDSEGQAADSTLIQRFIFTDRTGDDGEELGWQVELEPGVRYTYGTYQDDEWTWRVDFDLSRTVDAPPSAWGHEGGYLN
ncbi:MAG: hypothetical protein JJU03_11655 [Idiomarina sp.]|nr:hypothetical protein [Idiomarina sp.]